MTEIKSKLTILCNAFFFKDSKNIFFFFIFLIFISFIFLYDHFLNETFYNYNFFYKSNVLDFYFIRDHFQLLATKKEYYLFFDLGISIILVNFIYNKIYLIESNKKFITHLKIIWIFKALVVLFFFAIYEKTLLLDQNIFFFFAINDFETIEQFSYKSKFIADGFANYFVVNIVKFINLFFFKSWYCLKIVISFLYLITVIYSFKIIRLFKNTNKVYFIYILALLPSFIYSSSIVVKDILIMPAFVILFYNYFRLFLYKNDSINKLAIIIFCLIYISFLRSWIGIACLLSISIYPTYLFLNKIKQLMIIKKKTNVNFIILICLFFLLFLILFDLIINNHSYLQYEIYDSFRNYKANENYNTGLNLFNNVENYFTFFIKIPVFYFYSIFNPFLEKITQTKYFIFVLENLLLVMLIIITIFKSNTKNVKILLLTFIPFLIIFMSLYTFVSYANIGTGFRYSIQAKIPIIIMLYILNKKSIEKLFSFFFKNIIKY